MNKILGFIGGSGLYNIDFLEDRKEIELKTSWGEPSDKIIFGKIDGNVVYFLSRHGKGHIIPPSSINYRANIDSLKQCGVTDLISISAVGSLKEKLCPGTFVVVDQFIDRTFSRNKTFFDEGIVAHVPLGNPTSKILRDTASNILSNLKISFQNGGTYVVMEGPQFSTRAESELYRSWKADVIGMTNMPEAKLAREAEIRYCSISMVTDYDCWHEDHDSVDVEMLIKNLQKNAQNALNFIKEFTIEYYNKLQIKDDNTSTILDTSIVTQKKYWKEDTKKKLSNILSRYVKEN